MHKSTFQVNTYFVAMKNVSKGDADHIVRAISASMDERFETCSWKEKLVAMGTDGASVMVGNRSGVVTRMKEIVDHNVISIHCSAHRFVKL